MHRLDKIPQLLPYGGFDTVNELAVGWVSEKWDCNESIPHAKLQ